MGLWQGNVFQFVPTLCRAFSRVVMDEKPISVYSPRVEGMVTNDWYIRPKIYRCVSTDKSVRVGRQENFMSFIIFI